MRFIRTLLLLAAILLALVGVVIAAAFLPPVQAWWFQTRVLDPLAAEYPGLHATVDSVSAGLSSVELTHLKLERNGIVFTAPDVQARLPLTTAVLDRKLLVSRLAAKGWTLALGPQPGPVTYDANGDVVPAGAGNSTAGEPTARDSAGAATATAGPAATSGPAAAPGDAARRLKQLLSGWLLPFDGSIDGAELEGDVLVPPRSGHEPLPVHVVAQGGGLGAGRTATFTVSGSGPTGMLALPEANASGKVALTVTAARELDRLDFSGTVSPAGRSHGVDLVLNLGGLAAATAQTLQLDASRNGRHLAVISATLANDSPRVAGTWKMDLGRAELARLWPDGRVPFTSLAGEGTFDADVDLNAVHAAGKANGAAAAVAELVPALARVGAVTVQADFDAVHTGGAARLSKLNVTVARVARANAADIAVLAGSAAPTSPRSQTLAVVTAKQPFTVADTTWHPAPTNPNADWLDVSLHDCPLAILPPLPGGYRFGQGDATGDFTIMAVNGGYGVRANGPIVARGVSVRRDGHVIATGLDLALTLLADNTPEQGWVLRAAPLRVTANGRELATVTARMPLRHDEYGRLPLTGTWKADFDTIRAVLDCGGFGDPLNARTGSGDFTANLGAAADLTAKVTLVGHDATHTVSATISGSVDDYRSATFEIPVRIAFGGNASQVTINGTCVADPAGPRLDLQVASPQVSLGHLKWLAAVVPATRGAFPGARRSVAAAAPFWGTAIGRIRFDIQRVLDGTHEWDQLGGTLELQHTSLTLHGGRVVYNPVSAAKIDPFHREDRTMEPHSTVAGEGTLTFDAAADLPYHLNGGGTVDGVNIAHFLAPVREGEQPTLEGRFAVTDTITAAGRTLPDIIAHRQEQFRLTSDAGIVRALKTNVAAALPNPESKVGDAAAGVGSAVSALFGHKLSGNVKVDPRTDAVLNFSYSVAEIGFDHFTATATRQPDGSYRLSDVDIRSAHEHLTGGGAIASAVAVSIAARPLTLDLRLGVKGVSADRLAKAGLLAPGKDALGYALVREPIPLGGTLDQVDATAWRDLLARAILTPAAK